MAEVTAVVADKTAPHPPSGSRALKRRSVLAAGAGLALLPSAARPQALEKVTLAQNLSPISGVTIVALARGFFRQNGLDVQVSNFTTGKQCLDTVVGGGAQVATTAEAPVTAAAMAGQTIAFLARTEYSNLKTLVTAKSGITSVAGLRGKRIAYTAGTGGEVYTAALLRRAGLSSGDVQLVNLRPQDMVAAMASGGIDAYNTWEPHVGNGRKALGNEVLLLDTAGVYAETFNIVVMRDYLAAKPQAVRSFLTALVQAEAWMRANRQDAIDVVAETVRMPASELAPIWDDFVYGLALDQRTLDVLDAHARWRLESGNHPPGARMPDWAKVIAAEPLRNVAPDRVATIIS